jgi:hypothetical protein
MELTLLKSTVEEINYCPKETHYSIKVGGIVHTISPAIVNSYIDCDSVISLFTASPLKHLRHLTQVSAILSFPLSGQTISEENALKSQDGL